MTQPAAAAPVARKTPRSAPSIISADMTVVGAITAGGDIQVDGKVEGDIVSDSLTVGEHARIKGELLAEEVIVRGLVEGSIKAEKVQLCAGARVHGDILHAALAVETGALFEGNCRHSDDPLGRKSDKPQTHSMARMETGPAPVRDEAPAEPAKAEADVRTASEPKADAPGSPAAKFKPGSGTRPDSNPGGNGRESRESAKDGSGDLGKISPGRMRAGTEAPAQGAKGK